MDYWLTPTQIILVGEEILDSSLVHCCRGPRHGHSPGRVWMSLAELGTVLAFVQFYLTFGVCYVYMLCFRESLHIFSSECVCMFTLYFWFKISVHVNSTSLLLKYQ